MITSLVTFASCLIVLFSLIVYRISYLLTIIDPLQLYYSVRCFRIFKTNVRLSVHLKATSSFADLPDIVVRNNGCDHWFLASKYGFEYTVLRGSLGKFLAEKKVNSRFFSNLDTF